MNNLIAVWLQNVPPENVTILVQSKPPIVFATVRDLRTAKLLADRLYEGVLGDGAAQVWTAIDGDLRRFYDHYRTSAMQGHTAQLTKHSTLQDAIVFGEWAKAQGIAVEITSMANHLTMYCNMARFDETEGVPWTQNKMTGFSALNFWEGFEDDFRRLMAALEADGEAIGIELRNSRIDGDGYNWFKKDYFLIDGYRVSITRDWKHIKREVAIGAV